MANSELVNIMDTSQQLLQMFAGSSFFQLLVLDDQLEQFTSARKLHYQVQIFVGFDDFVDLDDVGMVELFEYFYLAADSFDIFLVLDFRFLKHLHCNLHKKSVE